MLGKLLINFKAILLLNYNLMQYLLLFAFLIYPKIFLNQERTFCS